MPRSQSPDIERQIDYPVTATVDGMLVIGVMGELITDLPFGSRWAANRAKHRNPENLKIKKPSVKEMAGRVAVDIGLIINRLQNPQTAWQQFQFAHADLDRYLNELPYQRLIQPGRSKVYDKKADLWFIKRLQFNVQDLVKATYVIGEYLRTLDLPNLDSKLSGRNYLWTGTPSRMEMLVTHPKVDQPGLLLIFEVDKESQTGIFSYQILETEAQPLQHAYDRQRTERRDQRIKEQTAEAVKTLTVAQLQKTVAEKVFLQSGYYPKDGSVSDLSASQLRLDDYYQQIVDELPALNIGYSRPIRIEDGEIAFALDATAGMQLVFKRIQNGSEDLWRPEVTIDAAAVQRIAEERRVLDEPYILEALDFVLANFAEQKLGTPELGPLSMAVAERAKVIFAYKDSNLPRPDFSSAKIQEMIWHYMISNYVSKNQ